MLQKAPSPLVNPNPTAGLSSTAKLHPFPEIVREDLRARVFNRETSAGPTHEFEDPASNATPDAENLANLGDSVLRLIVTGLVSEMYPGLQAAPAAVSTMVVNWTLINPLSFFPCTCWNRNCGIRYWTMQPWKISKGRQAFIGAIQLEQGFESAKRLLDAPFRDYLTSAYNLLRESYGYASKQISPHIGAPAMPQPQPPPSPSSPDSSTNYLGLLNESLQKSNRQAKWVYTDHPKENAQKWSVEVLVDGEVFGWGEGSTKKAARNEAAKQALSRLA
ncbi:ribonuclease III [Mycena olivaceomarginata]|nr:ribonuclease III [Mycena olivaceomarginata]